MYFIKIFSFCFALISLAFFGFNFAHAAEGDFTIVLFPDTEGMVSHSPATWEAMTSWAANNKTSQNIKAVIGLGDVTGDNSDSSFSEAQKGWDMIKNAGIIFGPVIGEKDYDGGSSGVAGRASTNWQKYFGASYLGSPAWLGGLYNNSPQNYWIKFEQGAEKYLIMVLEFQPRSEVLTWAQGIISANADRKAIVITHEYLTATGGRTTSGEQIWNNLISANKNVFMAVSGHNQGTVYSGSTNNNGDNVAQFLFDHENDTPNYGNGYLVLMKFQISVGQIEISTYSPSLNQEYPDGSYMVLYESQNKCLAGAVYGCGVCKADGSGWADNDSKCLEGQVCKNNACVASGICYPKTCEYFGYSCGEVSDGCGKTLNCGSCVSGTACSNNQCVTASGSGSTSGGNNGSGCVSHSQKKCVGNSIYWFNSCGTKQEFFRNCSDSTAIQNYRCNGNWLQFQKLGNGSCSAGACVGNFTWSNGVDCSANGRICKNSSCTSQSTNTGTANVNNAGTSAISIAVPTGATNKTALQAKIKAIIGLIEILQKQLALLTGKSTTAANSSLISCTQITKNLFYGMKNDAQVKCLQEFLKTQGFVVVATGNYDSLTMAIVKEFQQNYRSEILTPSGLTLGTGIVGAATRTKINQLLAKR